MVGNSILQQCLNGAVKHNMALCDHKIENLHFQMTIFNTVTFSIFDQMYELSAV